MASSKPPQDGRSGLALGSIIAFAVAIWPMGLPASALTLSTTYLSAVIGLPLTALALVLTAGRIFDMVADVAVGYLSDNFTSRFGRRKPWIIGGILLFVPALWLALIPGKHFTTTTYAVGLFLYFAGWASATVPFFAQSTELSTNAADRTRVSIWITAVSSAAVLSSFVFPFLTIDRRTYWWRLALGDWLTRFHATPMAWLAKLFRAPPLVDVQSYGRQILSVVILASVTAPFCILAYALTVRDATSREGSDRAPMRRQKIPVLAAIRNPVFFRFCLGELLIMTGYYGRFGLMAFILAYLFKSADFLLPMYITMFGAAFLAVPIWSFLFKRLERRTAISMAAMMEAGALLILIISPKGPGHEWIIFAAAILMGFPGQTLAQAPYLIAGECAEYCELRNGYNARAIHISTISTIMKMGNVAAAVQISVAGLLGFSPATANSESSKWILESLGLWAPIVLVVAGALVVLTHPLTRRRQRAIQRALRRRAVFLAQSAVAID